MMPDEPIATTPQSCVECGRPWSDPGEWWRSFLAVDDLDGMDPSEAALYCPDCSEQEFGSS
jgi:hypothetical protein